MKKYNTPEMKVSMFDCAVETAASAVFTVDELNQFIVTNPDAKVGVANFAEGVNVTF